MATILHFYNPKTDKEYVIILEIPKAKAIDIATSEFARPGFEFKRALSAEIEDVDSLPLEYVLMRE